MWCWGSNQVFMHAKQTLYHLLIISLPSINYYLLFIYIPIISIYVPAHHLLISINLPSIYLYHLSTYLIPPRCLPMIWYLATCLLAVCRGASIGLRVLCLLGKCTLLQLRLAYKVLKVAVFFFTYFWRVSKLHSNAEVIRFFNKYRIGAQCVSWIFLGLSPTQWSR